MPAADSPGSAVFLVLAAQLGVQAGGQGALGGQVVFQGQNPLRGSSV